jgi:hypothetical protein
MIEYSIFQDSFGVAFAVISWPKESDNNRGIQEQLVAQQLGFTE